MKALVTGGAGFIGRGVVRELLDAGHEVTAVDNLSNGRIENLTEFDGRERFRGLIELDLAEPGAARSLFDGRTWDRVYHLAASIHVQRSIDDPGTTFAADAQGTFNLLEACREQLFSLNRLELKGRSFDYARDVKDLVDRRPRVVCVSTCMVYRSADGTRLDEESPYLPTSPYAASKIAADMLALSYAEAYTLPVTVARPFNTYGPFQRSDLEGGVVSIFLKRDLLREPLLVKGDGEQTRDLLYVSDCARAIRMAGEEPVAEGQVINLGTGTDVSVTELAGLCLSDGNSVEHVPHDHPQAEIRRLVCDPSRARELLGWEPQVLLVEGLERTRAWLAENRWAW